MNSIKNLKQVGTWSKHFFTLGILPKNKVINDAFSCLFGNNPISKLYFSIYIITNYVSPDVLTVLEWFYDILRM